MQFQRLIANTFSSCTDPPCLTCALQINPSLSSFTPVTPALFKVGMGRGYLELPQGKWRVAACCVEKAAQKGLTCNRSIRLPGLPCVHTYLLSSVCPCPVEIPEGKLRPSLLESSGVYVLDCGADIFVWYVWMYMRTYVAISHVSQHTCIFFPWSTYV